MRILSLVVLFFALSVQAQSLDPSFDAIKSWKALGKRWAIAYDEKAQAIGFYDLSFAMPWTKVNVGTLSAPRVKFKDVLKAIAGGEIESADDSKLVDQAKEELQKSPDASLDAELLPKNWVDQVPWRGNLKPLSEVKSFTLADFDYQQIVDDQKKWNKTLSNIQALLVNDELMQDVFNQIEIVQSEKEFSIYFMPKNHGEISKPHKMADLNNAKWAFLEAMKLDLLEKSLGQLTNLILNPIVKAFVDTALNRVFHFVRAVNRTHEFMTLEVLSDLNSPNGFLPKNLITADNLKILAESTQYADSSLETSWQWIWKDPYKEWLKAGQKEADYSQKGQDWYNNHNVAFSLLTPSFGEVDKNLSILSMKKPSKHGPFVAHINGKPSYLKGARIRTEILTTAVVFGTKFIPLVGGALKYIFQKVVEKPTLKERYWEGRLTAQLEFRESELNQDWEAEILSLDGQRVNPFFKKRADTLKLIAARKAAYNIH